MAMIPAMITGTMFFTNKSGLNTQVAQIPTPDLAVPYEAPKQVNTMAAAQPMEPKNGA